MSVLSLTSDLKKKSTNNQFFVCLFFIEKRPSPSTDIVARTITKENCVHGPQWSINEVAADNTFVVPGR